MASFGEEASDDPAFRGVRRRRRMNQKSALFFRVVIILRLGLFLSNRMIPLRLLMGNALKNFEEISRDHADEPSALRKEEERERRTVVSSTNPDRFSRGRFFFSLLSGAKRIDTQSTTPTHTNRREEREIRGVCVKKGPQKKAPKKRPKKKASRKDAFYY